MKTALLCVSFGTSVPSGRKSIAAVENALRQEMPQAGFFRAYTSKVIRSRLAAEGEQVWSVEEALEKLTDGSYDRVVVQPTHFLYGLEYEKLRAAVTVACAGFPAIKLGVPLLSNICDLQTLAAVLAREYPQTQDECLLLIGHGTQQFSDAVYPAMQTVFYMMNRRDVLVGTLKGWPDIQAVISRLQEEKCTAVRMVPMMLTAGEHALKDMAGSRADSWKSCLEREGYQTECVMRGLGMDAAVQQMYRQHLRKLL